MINDLVISSEYTQDEIQLERYKNLMSSNCTVDYFLRLLKKFKIGNIKKIVIECAEHKIIKTTNYSDDMLGVKILRRQIDIDSFLKLTEIQRKKWTLDLLVSGFEELNKYFEFSMEEIYSFVKVIEDNNFLNHYNFGEIVSSPNKQFKSVLWIEHNSNKFNLFLKLLNKDGTIVKKYVVKKVAPYFIAYNQILGEIKWESNNVVKISNKKKILLKKIKF